MKELETRRVNTNTNDKARETIKAAFAAKNCSKCRRKNCQPVCFDSHPGSIIALAKLIKSTGKKVYVTGV
jgi:hypothetical protein